MTKDARIWNIAWLTTKDEWNKLNGALFNALVERMSDLTRLGLTHRKKVVVHMPKGGDSLKKAVKKALGKQSKKTAFVVHKKTKNWNKVVKKISDVVNNAVVTDALLKEIPLLADKCSVNLFVAYSDDTETGTPQSGV